MEYSNQIIQGDNVQVMNNLLDDGFVQSIDLMLWDPPYNTGSKNFMFHDSFGRSEWLQFMRERLLLARDLLKDSGSIAIHIGYKELFYLGILMDEVFGESNRLAIVNWECTYSPKNDNKGIPSTTDYVLIYARSKKLAYRGIIPRTDAMNARYKNIDTDPRGPWKSSDITVGRGPWIADNLTVGMNASMRPNQAYDLVDPKTGKTYKFNPNRVWRFIPSTMEKMIQEDRIIFPGDCNKVPRFKCYLNELRNEGRVLGTYWESNEVICEGWRHEISGHNGEAKSKLIKMLPGLDVFSTPKPLKLTKRIIQLLCPPDGIVLDAFAGSGTTAHAIIELNDNHSRRKYILIEINPKIAEIAIRRIEKVLNERNDQDSSESI